MGLVGNPKGEGSVISKAMKMKTAVMGNNSSYLPWSYSHSCLTSQMLCWDMYCVLGISIIQMRKQRH